MIQIKKKIYKTCVVQWFNAFHAEEPKKWWQFLVRVFEKRDYITNYEHYILAESEKDAVKKYKSRYKWCDYDRVIDKWWGGIKYPRLNEKNPDFQYTVYAEECYPTFDKLKKEMRADEFLEYCRQEMFPVEELLTD